MPNVLQALTICVKLKKFFGNDTVEAFFKSPMSRMTCKISDDECMQCLDVLTTQWRECFRNGWLCLGSEDARNQLETSSSL